MDLFSSIEAVTLEVTVAMNLHSSIEAVALEVTATVNLRSSVQIISQNQIYDCQYNVSICI